MPSFVYRCSGCDCRIEQTRHDMAGTRHVIDRGTHPEVCGVLRRDYKAEAVGIDTSNLRSAR